jgi:hypothetical protein
MVAIASLAPIAQPVEPGQSRSTKLSVRNGGSIVDRFTFEALGPAAAWVRFEPDLLNLFPGSEDTVTVTVSPPRHFTTTAGTVPLGVRIHAAEDPEGSVVEETSIEILPFSDLFAELVPRTAQGRRRAKTQLAIDNRGNWPAHGTLKIVQPDNLAAARFSSGQPDIRPGTATFVDVTVEATRTFRSGPPKSIPFQIVADLSPGPVGEPPPPLTAAGTFVQQATMPKWLGKVAAAVLAAIIVLAVLWFAVLKPTIKSQATKAAAPQVAAAQQAAAAAQKSASAAQQAASGASGSSSATPGSSNGASNGAANSNAANNAANASLVNGNGEIGGTPFSTRLESSPTDPNPAFTVPVGKEYNVTDIVLENPAGDAGVLQVVRGTTLLQVNLQNFRDLDYHFVAPVLVSAGDSISLQVQCGNPAPGTNPAPNSCTPAALLSGFIDNAPAATPST